MKVLFVSLFLPLEKSYHAGGRYVFELLRQLSARHEIHLATRLQEDEFPLLEELRPFCREIHPFPYPVTSRRGAGDKLRLALNYLRFSRFAHRLIGRGGYDLVQVEWVETAILIGRQRTPMVMDAHDVISKPAEREAARRGGLAGQLRHLLVRSLEKGTLRRFRVVITLSDFDRDYLRGMLPRADIRSVPIPAGLDFTGRPFTPRPHDLLFLASYRFRPVNVEAARWFATRVFPLIRREFPDARFIAAGYGPPPELTVLAVDPAILVPGFVDDLEQCYREAGIFVAPILTGGGIIVKILDALAAGIPVVTTSFGNEGIGGVPGEELLVADDPEAFAAAVLRLLREPELRERLATGGRGLAARRFSLATVTAGIEAAWAAALGC